MKLNKLFLSACLLAALSLSACTNSGSADEGTPATKGDTATNRADTTRTESDPLGPVNQNGEF